jgi:hypothetical protein
VVFLSSAVKGVKPLLVMAVCETLGENRHLISACAPWWHSYALVLGVMLYILAGLFLLLMVLVAVRAARVRLAEALDVALGWGRVPNQTRYRSVFADTPIPLARVDKNHTHGQSAADRRAASEFAKTYAASLGLRPFFYQQSASDQRAGEAGSRSFYWSKDLNGAASCERPTEGDLVVMIDVDYYVDMPAFLAENRFPTLLYTVVPQAVCFDDPNYDYAFTFNKKNEMKMLVKGGAKYKHRLWNWGVQALSLSDYKTWWLPSTWVTTSYLVEHKAVAKHATLLAIVWSGWPWFLGRSCASGSTETGS